MRNANWWLFVTRLLHTTPTIDSLSLLVVITIAAMGTAMLLGIAIAAFLQRESQSYLLVVVAFSALFGRSIVAGINMVGLVSPTMHHFLEHGMDVVLVAVVIAAVYYARNTTEQSLHQ